MGDPKLFIPSHSSKGNDKNFLKLFRLDLVVTNKPVFITSGAICTCLTVI